MVKPNWSGWWQGVVAKVSPCYTFLLNQSDIREGLK